MFPCISRDDITENGLWVWELSVGREDVVMGSLAVAGGRGRGSWVSWRPTVGGWEQDEVGNQGITKQLQNSLVGGVTHPGLSHPELSNSLPPGLASSVQLARLHLERHLSQILPTPWDRVGGVPGQACVPWLVYH